MSNDAGKLQQRRDTSKFLKLPTTISICFPW